MHSPQPKKILVTGAWGLIGRYTAEALHDAGYEVVTLGRVVPEHKNGRLSQMIKTDLQEESSASVLETIHPDVIAHCAAVLPVVHRSNEAERAADLNRRMDGRIINHCRENRCALLYASSTSVYPLGESVIDEESSVLPQGPYAQAKWESEMRIMREVGRFVILRIHAPYGRRQRTKTVLSLFIDQALSGQTLSYHGSGKREQDFVAAEDVAQAFVCATAVNDLNAIFNIAGGRPISMHALAKMVVRLVPGTKSVVMASGQPDPQEDYRALFNIGKAKEVLHWTPSITLEEGIRRWVLEREVDR